MCFSGVRHISIIKPRAIALVTIPLVLILSGCLGYPEGIEPVKQFDLKRYLGKWYEIARLDHSFERGLNQVTAHYALRDDGGLDVINRGYSDSENRWKEAQGRAYFVDSKEKGHLKVSFFGPLYGSYVIFGLDEKNYQYSFVSGPNRSYLWLLARTPNVEQELIHSFVKKSRQLGFDTNNLIFVGHR